MFFNKLLIFPPPLNKINSKISKKCSHFFFKKLKKIYFYFVSKLKKDILINQYFKLLAF